MYAFHWVFIVGVLAFSWARSRHLLHPHFMFTCMLVLPITDFLVRGYDDPNIDQIQLNDLFRYQLLTSAVVIALVGLSSLVRFRFEREVFSRDTGRGQSAGAAQAPPGAEPAQQTWVLIGATTVVAFEILKRLYVTGGDTGAVWTQMLGPRGMRDWDTGFVAFGNNPIFQLISSLLPLSAIAYPYLMVVGTGWRRLVALLLFPILLFILVTDGTRTPVVMAMASLVLFQLIFGRTRLSKVAMAVGCILAVAFLSSQMYLFRTGGFLYEAAADSSFVYHQDDTIYRAWSSYWVADRSILRWDLGEWVVGILTNPVPRGLWPDKPLLDDAFFGAYKPYYMMIWFVGENVALFGGLWGSLAAVVVGMATYLLLYGSSSLLRGNFGVPAYLVMALYAYMVLRSNQSLTSVIWLPAFALAAHWFLNRSRHKPRRASWQPT